MATILVIDDRETNREILVTLFGHRGHRTLEASDGAEGLAAVRAERPDLVITDILMPTMDGFEFVHALRRDPAVAGTPVIFYSATYHQPQAHRLAHACGVSRFLVRPCEPKVILETVEAVLGGVVTQPAAPSEEFGPAHTRLLTDNVLGKVAELETVSLRLAALLTLGQQLALERDPRGLFQKVCRGARELIAARYAVVGILDDERQSLRHYHVSGMSNETVARMGIPRPFTGVLGRVLGERSALRLANPGGAPESLGLPASHPHLGAFLGVPIASATHAYGWLYLGDKLGGEEFAEEDERVALTLVTQAAITYEDLRRYDEIQRHVSHLEWEVAERARAERDLQARAHQHAVIAELGQRALAGMEPAALMDEAARLVASALGLEYSEILELLPEGRSFVLRAGVGWNTALLGQLTVDASTESPAGHALRSGAPVIIEDLTAKSRFEMPPYLRDHGVASGVSVVIRGKDRSYGVLAAHSARPRGFTQEDIDFLHAVANVLATAVDRRQEEDRLTEALRRAEESDRLKTAFLSNMSHEVRTPLNAILGYSSLIADAVAESGDESLRPMLAGIGRSSERLLQTMHAVVDISKIQTGGFRMSPARVELGRLLERQVENVGDLAAEKHLDLSCTIESPGAAVIFDQYCLSHALTHLLDNAIKFTREGSVAARLYRDAQGVLRLSIRDTGVGIDPDYLPRVFTPFSQADPSCTRRYEGSGLGLALVKKYLELNGAEIAFESEQGKGSIFTICFPAALEAVEAEGAPAAETRQTPVPPRRSASQRPTALVVEDDPNTQLCMKAILQSEFDALIAASGEEARAQLAGNPDQIQVVLMDISLKGSEDGLTLTRYLRSQDRWKDVPIIATTAHAFPEDRASALAAGCDAYLAKPFDRGELLSLMRTMLASARGADAPLGAGTPWHASS